MKIPEIITVPADWDEAKDEQYTGQNGIMFLFTEDASAAEDLIYTKAVRDEVVQSTLKPILDLGNLENALPAYLSEGLPLADQLQLIRSAPILGYLGAKREQVEESLDACEAAEKLRVDVLRRYVAAPDQVWLRELVDAAAWVLFSASALNDLSKEIFKDVYEEPNWFRQNSTI